MGTLALAWLAHRLVARLLRAFRSRIAPHITDAEDARRADTLARVSRHMATVVIVLIAGMLVLSELGISVAPILGAAGVVGLAFGFGAQSLVKDYVSGFFLLLENQVTKGDVVEIAGKSGEVEDVTLRYVQLRDYGGNVHFVPNGLITIVTNMSRGFAYAVIEVGVAHERRYSPRCTPRCARWRAAARRSGLRRQHRGRAGNLRRRSPRGHGGRGAQPPARAAAGAVARALGIPAAAEGGVRTAGRRAARAAHWLA